MKKFLTVRNITIFSAIFILLMILMIPDVKLITAESLDSSPQNIAAISATDALGRTLSDISGSVSNKYVGLFYFLWLGQQNQENVYDITKILNTTSLEKLIDTKSEEYPNVDTYFFNEPLYGYYNSADPFVIHKHIELFIAADIDFLVFDTTNGILYNTVWAELLDALEEYRQKGWKVPQIVFFTNTASGNVVDQLYKHFYSKEVHKELWFYGPYDKPLIIAKEEELPQKYLDFFHVRPPQWPLVEKKENGFPYMNLSKPQDLYTDLMNVSVCQFSGPCSYGVTVPLGSDKGFYGRGYSKDTPESGNVQNILEGRNFQEQWDYAIETDPEIIFITGWNEWIAQKSEFGWIDTFTTEWSRDIEMTKATTFASDDVKDYSLQGYGDNYYLQMVENIRRYKGKDLNRSITINPISKTMDISSSPSQWDSINEGFNTFYNMAVSNMARDFIGASPKIRYTQAPADNFIEEIKVTHDDDNIYFYIQTENDIQLPIGEEQNHMNLLFSVTTNAPDKKKGGNWESFEYIINRLPKSQTQTSLEHIFTGDEGQVVYENIQSVSYSVTGNIMQIEIPLSLIGIKDKDFRIEFKVADSVENPEDIMDYYVSGCSVPLGRLKYVYLNGRVDNSISTASKSGLSALETTLLTASIAIIALASGGLIFIFKKRKN